MKKRAYKTFEAGMRSVLRLAYENPAAVKEIVDTNRLEYLFECNQQGYLLGMQMGRNGYGEVISRAINPRVTLKGLYFMDKADSEKRSRIAMILSVVSLVCTVLFNLLGLVLNLVGG